MHKYTVCGTSTRTTITTITKTTNDTQPKLKSFVFITQFLYLCSGFSVEMALRRIVVRCTSMRNKSETKTSQKSNYNKYLPLSRTECILSRALHSSFDLIDFVFNSPVFSDLFFCHSTNQPTNYLFNRTDRLKCIFVDH